MSLTTTTTTTIRPTSSLSTTRHRKPSISALNTSAANSHIPNASATKTLPRSLRKRLPTSTRSGRSISSISTPNLSSLFSSHARRPPSAAGGFVAGGPSSIPPVPSVPSAYSLPAPLLIRKASLAALTQSSLATIPDATESYAFDTLTDFLPPPLPPLPSDPTDNMAPLTPGRFASSMASYSGAASSPGDELAIGDIVDVPGGMNGTVRFVGSVAGRKGVFAGVELHPEFAIRGKNSGDVDGVSYFNTNVPGAGIFLPLSKALRRDVSPSNFPATPGLPGLKLGNQNSTNYAATPTPSLPKFSQSVNSGGPPRAPSPQHGARRPPRTSLPRPDSPVRRLQMTPGPGPASRPSLSTPAPKASATTASTSTTTTAGPNRFGSPNSTNKFSQSMRAPTTSGIGDPSKRGVGMTMGSGLGMFRGGTGNERKAASIGPRSASALGGGSNFGDDDMAAPLGPPGRSATTRTTNGSASGSVGSTSSFGRGGSIVPRPSSRATSHMKNGSIATTTTLANNDEEVERLRAELDERERQLKDQSATLADMESSLTELQGLIENSDGLPGMGGGGGPPQTQGAASGMGMDELDELKDLAQMRALLREKNDKIAMLTAEFDTHRADFRSTIDTLEMASTETERVYEKKIEELIQETQELEGRLADVDTVAQQLKQLEEVVQELEEGLEDARRGEAEARGEVEFLRGEVERTRTELRREREKLAQGGGTPAQKNMSSAAASAPTTMISPKDLEQKDDEIRGLKAIIHSLSQNTGVHDMPNGAANGIKGVGANGGHRRGESINERLAREALEREVADLRALLDTKSNREVEMEQELEQLRVSGPGSGPANNGLGGNHRTSAMTAGSRSSLRDSRGTVVLARDFRDATSNGNGLTLNGHHHQHHHSRSNSNPRAGPGVSASGGMNNGSINRPPHHTRGPTLDTMPESDAYSSVTESSTLWCEICETNGHDILTCTNMFGQAASKPQQYQPDATKNSPVADVRTGKDIVRAALASEAASNGVSSTHETRILPNPMEGGPVAGKESGVVDASKWCALCERDGHDSVDCPFEDAF